MPETRKRLRCDARFVHLMRFARRLALLALASVFLCSDPRAALAQESPPAKLGLELSTLAYGADRVDGDDSHYGSDDIYAAPGVTLSLYHRTSRRFALGALLEGQVIPSIDSDIPDEVRTHALGRFELSFAATFPLAPNWEAWPALGVGADVGTFDVGPYEFDGRGAHVSLRQTFNVSMSARWGLSTGLVGTIAAFNTASESDSYIDGAGLLYAHATLTAGVFWWPR